MIPNHLALGIDIIDIDRFAQYTKKNNLFLRNNFSAYELNYCFKFKDAAPHLAGIFAAKEAVYKALGQKILQSAIKIAHDQSGKPLAKLGRHALASVSVSISHSHKSAVAVAIKYEL